MSNFFNHKSAVLSFYMLFSNSSFEAKNKKGGFLLIAAFFDIIVWLCITSIPSKKQRRTNQNIKILKQQLWFHNLREHHGPLFLLNSDVRKIISHYNLQDEIHLKENMDRLKQEIENFIQTRNL